MFRLTNKELLGTLGRDECWFYAHRVDNRKNAAGLGRLFLNDVFTGMGPEEVCCFFIRGRDYVKLLKFGVSGWEVDVLSPAASAPYLALEWAVT